MKCPKCKKEKVESSFQFKSKIYKSCFECREQIRLWREKNKERVSQYNKFTTKKNNNNKKETVIYAKKKDGDEWLQFKSQIEAAKKLNLQTANISRVINGKSCQTGGYIFKIEEVEAEHDIQDTKTWEEIKVENNYEENVKGKPSPKRTLHKTVDNLIGKNCCTCKEWKPLDEYNVATKHWDKLRNDCKICLVKYRKKNVKKISASYIQYEKARKKTDPAFKLLKTLRSRLSNAVTTIKKSDTTFNLTNCSINFLMGYLEGKFTEGMTWENHGEWHIDHITPCCSFNLEKDDEQKKCFHYTNLQPLWATDNLVKGGKYI